MRGMILCLLFAVAAMVAFGMFTDHRSGRSDIVLPETDSTAVMTFDPPKKIEIFEARFALCDGPIRVNCVVDGDTLWFKGDKIRIADIDAPEIFPPHCRDEKHAGEMARDRLVVLLNAGGFTLVAEWRDTDRYGRKLRTVTRDDRSVGETLVEDGLAWRWNASERN